VDLIVPARKVRIQEAWVGEAGADVEEAWLRDGGYANGWRGDGLSRGEGAHVVVGYRVQFVSAGQYEGGLETRWAELQQDLDAAPIDPFRC
jgi:hypothetical protein